MSWRVNTSPVRPHGTRAELQHQGKGKVRGAVTDLHPWRGTDPAPTSLTSQAGTSEAAQEKSVMRGTSFGLSVSQFEPP